MTTTTRYAIRHAHQSYQSAEKAYKTAHRRFLMVARLYRERITQANFRAYGAAYAAERAASDAWLEAGIAAA